jgi:hypothetical protein
MDIKKEIKELELKKLKLFGKALKMFPSSPAQLAIHEDIKGIFQKIETLKNGAK